ncbi:DUF4276 family protein [Pectobacterium aquaticum]|uniref:DUF4276 family protein n=1 Tax=Pectobacterium aquaticum TaxID=2204145 RepID=UPI000E257102|nr:DUF4276 family protein [Pectobacterium aquaticum]UEM39162.1 DUF4276 family protein [Pectobacterium aquaticum]
MIRICIICEGQTEVEFIRKCISPYLIKHNVCAYPSILQSPSGRGRGGRVTVERIAKHMSHEYHATDRITSLVDFYGFQDADGRNRVELENAIRQRVAEITTGYDERFVFPYVQMYEFEALLFSDIEKFEYVLDGWNRIVRNALEAVYNSVDTPENINNSPQTAPSKRILSIFSDGSYNKTEHGPIIAEEIGLAKIREECPKFNEWISRLEQWGNV